ncbi:lytic polysaccharide monooxygenase [Streptomyces sp. MS06]|uniref:lytic polysaccharide monooxygenase auxiliary activity family 9 protein n=1 Tax=Streptomyces sp. MS06 TaxID=3385974 RepID=UPI0039A2A428
MIRRLTAVRALTGLTLLTLLMALPFAQRAEAHGSMISPASRTYACYQDGLQPSGEIDPVNPACAAAVAVSGTQPFYDWYGVLRSDGGGRTRGFIPDGQLCSGGSPKYAGLDIPSADWPTQNLRAGSDFDFVYAAWVPHPGSFRLYITKQGFDPTEPLRWDDLESAPFLTVDPEPPLTDGSYHLRGHLPDGLTGRHVIYSVWQRSDSTETFYNCSDVFLGDDETTPPPPPQPADCSASVTVDKSWPGGFQASVSVTNDGSRRMTDWAVQWTMPDGTEVSDGWNGTFMQNGSTAMVHAPDWHRILDPGETATAGFNGTADQVPQFTSVRCS